MSKFNDLVSQTQKLNQQLNKSSDTQARKKLQDKIQANLDELNKLVTHADRESQKQLERAIAGLQDQFNKFDTQSSKLDKVQNAFFRSTDNISNSNDPEVDRLIASIELENKTENQRKASEDAVNLSNRRRLDSLYDPPPSTTINTSNIANRDQDINQYVTDSFQKPLDSFEEEFNKLLALNEDEIDEQIAAINSTNNSKTQEEQKAELEEELATLISSENDTPVTTKISVATPEMPPPEKKEITIAEEETPAILTKAIKMAEKTLEIKNDNIKKLEDLGPGNTIRKDPARKAIAEMINKKIFAASSLFESLHILIIKPIETLCKTLKSLFGSSNKSEQAKNEPTPQSNTIDLQAQRDIIKKMETRLDEYKGKLKEKLKKHKEAHTDPKKDPSVQQLIKIISNNKTNISNMKLIENRSTQAEKLKQQVESLSTRRLSH